MQTNSDKFRFRQKIRQLQKIQKNQKIQNSQTNSDKIWQIQTNIQTNSDQNSDKFRPKFRQVQKNSDKSRQKVAWICLILSVFVYFFWICLIFLNLSESWSEFVWFFWIWSEFGRMILIFLIFMIFMIFQSFLIFYFSVWIQTLRQISPILDKHLEVGMECGLSFPSEDFTSHSFTFIFSLSLFLFLSCSHPALFCLLPALFGSLSLLQVFFFVFLIFSTFSFSLSMCVYIYVCIYISPSRSLFVLLCFFSILSREVSASSLSLPSLCATSRPVLTVWQVFRCFSFVSEMFVVLGGEEGQLKWEKSSDFKWEHKWSSCLLISYQNTQLSLTNLGRQVSKPH